MSSKKNISVRLTESDLRRLKDISTKLGVKESDVFRFSVRLTLSTLMPLLRHDIKGIDVILALLSSNCEMLRYFEFDAHQIDNIVNANVPHDERISHEDIDLVAIASLNESYLASQLKSMGWEGSAGEGPVGALRDYLSNKYLENNESSYFAAG